MKQKIIIFDTTLRDGEQSLHTNLNTKEKLEIALALESMGVNIIEAGFPISSPGEFQSVKTISQNIHNSKICGLARCIEKDIDIAAQALQYSKEFRIHLFLSTSNIHIQSKLKKNFNDIIEMTIHSIKKARNYTDDIEFSFEDATRTPIKKLCKIVEIAIKAGANTINIPDTVGYSIPNQFNKIIQILFDKVKNINQAIISVHCHNDLGMAIGNTISAIQAGARQIEGTINGIGERAGNTALEEIIMAIKIHKNLLNVYTDIHHKKIHKTSLIVKKICNIPMSLYKPIVGKNAFFHSSGIHQDGILKNRKNYEVIDPIDIGLNTKIQFNFTARSGRAAIKHQMNILGYNENDYDIKKLYQDFLIYADKKGNVFDYDLEYLAFTQNQKNIIKQYFYLKYFKIQSTSAHKNSIAYVKLLCGKKTYTATSVGNSPIIALYQSLINIINLPITLDKYQINIINSKNLTKEKVNITLKYSERNFYGIGKNTNIITSSAQAIISALNSIWKIKQIYTIKKSIKK